MKRSAMALLAVLFAGSLSGHDYSLIGSRTMFDLNRALADRYHAAHPDVAINVSDAGTGKGIDAAIAGKADIAAVTRRLRPEELEMLRRQVGGDGAMVPLAREGIAIYVNQRNPVSELTPQEIAAIFSGKITNWSAVGGPNLPIHVYSFDNSTGRYWYLNEEVMQKAPLVATARYTDAGGGRLDAGTVKLKEEQMQGWVAADPAAIGYGDLKRIGKVKLVAVMNGGRAYLPTPANLQAGVYPLVRTLAYFFRRPPGGDLAAFSRWAASQRELIELHGFAPLK